ncbi:MAG: BspA family leucine-rich repeat surface protein [Gammaproteobacteria bacterium]|nr:BspA family leucine-rich repeat surface protein [Gammaproteobacteria bacterium]
MNDFIKELVITRVALMCLIMFSLVGCSGGSGGGEPPVSEPSLSLDNLSVNYLPIGEMIVPIRFINSGGGSLLECRTDSLPAGLAIQITTDGNSCEIIGTPNTLQGVEIHRIIAENDTGISDVWIDISVTSPLLTTWKTDNPGVSGNNQVLITTSPNHEYDYNVDWGDGTKTRNIQGDYTHDYDSPGTYTITISGLFPQTYFDLDVSLSDAQKLLTIEQWGTYPWRGGYAAFANCENLVVEASDTPNMSFVTDMRFMFYNATNFNADISQWDVSSVEKMHSMFYKAINFNGDISQWDVSSVSTMSRMFAFASKFKSDLSQWDVSNVTDMRAMFYEATSFNSDISQWDVSNVRDMGLMFTNAVNFNSDISQWDVSSVTSMFAMFNVADNFNSDISQWDVSSVTSMYNMFHGADNFNSDISQWDVSSVTSMHGMFSSAVSFNRDISQWDVSSVDDMSYMFDYALSFNQNIGGWNIESVTDMTRMFRSAKLSTENYDALLLGWSSQNVQQDVVFDAGSSAYSSAGEIARNVLIDNYNWVIYDAGNFKALDPNLVERR